MRIEEGIDKLGKWSRARNIIDGSTPTHQMLKAMEELGELAGAIARNNRDGVKDGIGDVITCLNNIALQNHMTLAECATHAYEEIKNRRGKLVDNVFIKEEDLNNG
jgi:NTP pyrophosphatase (non-canonical NTP hydrolase)